VHIEKEITTDTVIDGQGEREVKVEETKITTIRKRKKRVVEVPSEEIEGPNLGA
jgi:hypothetical protein